MLTPSPSSRLKQVIEQRLAQLLPDALRLTRLIAVGGTGFSVDLAARVLGKPADLVAEPWKELERAHILRGEWFAHDLLAQVVLEMPPCAIREALKAHLA